MLVDKTTSRVALFILAGLILVFYLGAATIQTSHAQEAVRIFRVKTQLDKSEVTRGDTQTIGYRVADAISGQPVSGAVVRATVKYADGVTVRQFANTTDAAGYASISWQIEKDAVPGTFATAFSVSSAAYIQESFNNSFAVVVHSINKNHNHHHHLGFDDGWKGHFDVFHIFKGMFD